jgi:hypothetical protein
VVGVPAIERVIQNVSGKDHRKREKPHPGKSVGKERKFPAHALFLSAHAFSSLLAVSFG